MSDICPTCGLPQDLCVCETIAKESQVIRISEDRKRFGKRYTIIKGIDDKEIDLKDLTKKLKGKFACGGTVKVGTIELQGEHKQGVMDHLINLGFSPDSIQIDDKQKKKFQR